VALVFSGTRLELFINGISAVFAIGTGTGILSTAYNHPFYIGNTFGRTEYFVGMIDEVRVWNVARSQTQIRNTMCQKLVGNESGLVGYCRFDEETDSPTCPDYTSNGNDGTMFNFGTNAGIDIRNARVCSAAPIGDDSAYDYYDSGVAGTVSAQLAHSDGDYMFATQNSGIWTDPFSGLHIYRLDEAPVYPPDLWDAPDYPVPPYGYQTPNGLTPPATWSSIDYYRYCGVFVTDWADVTNQPVYDAFYYYDGNPSVPGDADGSPAPNPQIGLAKRPAYCFGTWSDSGANWAFGTLRLELFGESQYVPPATNPEYVLGGINQPLAIALASFYAEFDKSSDCIRITWKTATEVDTIGFQLWRSDTKEGPYILVPGSFMPSQSVSETTGAEYTFLDCDADLDTYMTYYYKLEEIDLDNEKDNPTYGPIGPVTETVSASQFSKSNASTKSDSGCFIESLILF